MERIIGSIKNTVSKSITGPHQIKMDDEELLTWTQSVAETLNNRPLILGTPIWITLTPNHVLQGFRENYGDEINPDSPVQHQLSRWKIVLHLFNSLWEKTHSFLETSKLSPSSRRYCPLQERTDLSSLNFSRKSRSSPPQEQRRCLRSLDQLPPGNRRPEDYGRQTS